MTGQRYPLTARSIVESFGPTRIQRRFIDRDKAAFYKSYPFVCSMRATFQRVFRSFRHARMRSKPFTIASFTLLSCT
ncbi:hypothetical protein [Paraburkholderia fynbosensis]|uniref:Uncharacterized protein n=1 Tax=Paraburkholderia fynbosensis TaxID=1200993 RepID=A0A6J5GXU5_9BURK|nr:hypothetical protein [Paraburkholderia fynbosensis]CAB3808712.1 hypothetical protein LMG27177_06621 [Paraburkholderia fynbosensis]